MVIRTFFLFLLLLLPFLAAGEIVQPFKEAGRYLQEDWDHKRGLPGNTVYQVLQTRDQYIWLATSAGLVRFDGMRFKLCDSGVYEELKGEAAFALLEDSRGALWVGTIGRAAVFKDCGYTVNRFDGMEGLRLRDIKEDSKGQIWIASEGAGVYCSAYDTGRLVHRYYTGNGLSSDMARSLYIDRDDTVWVGTLQGLNAITGGKIRIYGRNDGLAVDEIRCIAGSSAPRGNYLWITTSSGLVRYKNSTFSGFPLTDKYSNKDISALLAGPEGELWLGVRDLGVLLYKNGKFSVPLTGDELTKPMLRTIFRDSEGNTWFGSLGSGLKKITPGKFITFNRRNGFTSDTVFGIFEDSRESLWFSTDHGLHCLRDGKITIFTKKDGLSGNSVFSICEDREGNFWIGTRESGLNRYNPTAKSFSQYSSKQGFEGDSVYALHLDKEGVVWVGTSTGLKSFENNRFTTYTKMDGMSDDFVRYIVHDLDNNLWVGTDAGGLNLFKNGQFLVFDKKKGLTSNRVLAIHIDEENELWVGTYNGLNRIKDGVITPYTRKDGLFDGLIAVILEDDYGNLWLGGEKGISRVSKKDLKDFSTGRINSIPCVVYDERDGMDSRVCMGGSRPSACKTRDGKLWFPTIKGAAVIDPAKIGQKIPGPAVIIEELKIDEQVILIGSQGRLQRGKSLVIPQGKKRLEFFYTAPSFIKPQQIKFKIKLEGYDNDWLDMGTARSTNYTGLSPGEYTFRVAACSADGVWNEEGASFSFYKKPYWYQTGWAYLVFIICLLLGITFFIKWRSWKLLREKKQLEQVVKDRTKEIKDKNSQLEDQTLQLQEQSEKLKELDKIKSHFFANISHEFRTPLTLIMGPLEQRLSKSSDKRQEEETKMMLRNSRRLLGLINQLLDLSKLESGRMQLQAAQQDIIPFLKGVVGSFQSLVVQKELNLGFQSEQESITLFFDAEKLEKVMVNLMANAIKFTPAGGIITATAAARLPKNIVSPVESDAPASSSHSEVYVSPVSPVVKNKSGYLEIKVSDTGIGIPEDQLPFVFDRFYRAGGSTDRQRKGTGIGLALVKELVELHYGEVFVRSTRGKGSEFTIHLPLGKDHLNPEEIVTSPQPVRPGETGYGQVEDIEPETKIEQEKEDGAEGLGKDKQEKNVILVVDDNPDVRKFIRRTLEPHYIMVEAADGKEGILKARKIIPDLIVSDVMMPEMDGYELCDILKKDVKTSHIPIILLTAKASEQSVIQGLQTGADDYITKPFNTKILLTRIQNLIDLRRGLQEKIQREMVLQPSEIAVSSVDQEFVKELKEIIEKNISDDKFSVDRLAKALYMGRTTLNRKIRAITGESTNQFILSYRLKRAAQLLKANFGNVTEVSFAVGFSSSAYFTKCFRDKFHQPPHTYLASEAE